MGPFPAPHSFHGQLQDHQEAVGKISYIPFLSLFNGMQGKNLARAHLVQQQNPVGIDIVHSDVKKRCLVTVTINQNYINHFCKRKRGDSGWGRGHVNDLLLSLKLPTLFALFI